MGLCKCPKRKVTNQFCFEHRVNVCEHCMVQKHPKCVVQSYLQWLNDSDYNPKCEFCDCDLQDEECVRLQCYHVFHWACLDKYARSFPLDSTAPAGYVCPISNCKECLFPPDNLVSPVADALRDRLRDVNWARAGLGLPLLEGREERRPVPSGPRPPPEGGSYAAQEHVQQQQNMIAPVTAGMNFDTPTSRKTGGSTLVDLASLSESPLIANPSNSNTDVDDDKYKRKSALEMLLRWGRTLVGPASRRKRGSRTQRLLMIIFLAFMAFVTFIVVMSYLSKGGDNYDPMLEPMNNPNIHVGVD